MLPWHPFDPGTVAALTGLLESGAVKPFIDRTYAFDDIPAALTDQKNGKARGMLVVDM